MKPADTIKGLRAYRHRMMSAIRNGECTDDEKRQYMFRFSFKPAGYGNMGGRFNLKRYVREMDTPLTVVCSECGMLDRCSYDQYTNKQMLDHQMCFGCNLWDSRRNALKSGSIVNGMMYSIRPAKNPHTANRSMIGHGGAMMLFTNIKTGETSFSNDVWNGGTLPTHMLAEFPDTHTMETMTPKDYADAYFSNEDSRNRQADQVTRHHSNMSRDEAKFHLSNHFWDPSRVLKHLAMPSDHQYRNIKEYVPNVDQQAQVDS